MIAPGLMARKVGMTRMFDDKGQLVPVTLLKVEEAKVTKVLTPERDGYRAIQIGYYPKSEHKLSKPDIARLRKVQVKENFSRFKEFRLGEATEEVALGAVMDLTAFEGVASIDVTGLSKGRGFQGAVKRHGYKTGRRTHGSHFHRRPGSLGCRTHPGRVMKNKRMPGHMGCEQSTVQNMRVLDIDPQEMTIAIKGSIPGHRDSFVMLQPSVKVKKSVEQPKK